jgi:hypothetical protein
VLYVRIVAASLALCGLMVLTFAFLEWRERTRFLAEALEATGEVVAVRQFATSGRKFSSTAYAFDVKYDSRRGSVQRASVDTSSSPRLAVGEKVRVWYSDVNPEIFRIDHFALMWGGLVILLALGGSFLGAGLTAFWIAGGRSPRGVKMEARLPEMARAWREGRLTRDSPYQALLVAFAFVGFPLLGAAIAFVLLAPGVLLVLVGGALAVIAFLAVRRRRRP